jgi:hypothetical protein
MMEMDHIYTKADKTNSTLDFMVNLGNCDYFLPLSIMDTVLDF